MTNLGFDPKVVLITGAGASVPFGLPTAAGFLDVLRGNNAIDQRYLEEAITASQGLVANTQIESVDVESLLDHLSSFSRGVQSFLAESKRSISKNEESRIIERATQYAKLREQILKSIVDTYGDVNAAIVGPVLHALTYGLSKCFDIKVLPVFTLNYDLAFETYVDQNQPKVEIIDGFDRTPSKLNRQWAREIIERSLAKPFPDDTELRLLLFKLHGSANWGRDSLTRNLHQIGLVPRDPGRYETVLYYPSLNEKPTYQEPFQTAFDYFLECVRRAETIVIIGTSFRDKSVTDILMRAKPTCPMVINGLSPTEPEFVKKLQEKGLFAFYVSGDIGEPFVRYKIVHIALLPWHQREGINRHDGYVRPTPIIHSMPYAGLHRLGKRPNAIVEGDVIAGPLPDYFLVSEGVRRHIPDIPTFHALGFELGNLIPFIEDSRNIPLGTPLQSLISDGILLQKPRTDEVYLVLDGALCQVVDQASLDILTKTHPPYGKYGQTEVRKDVSDDTFSSLAYADPVRESGFYHNDRNGNHAAPPMALHSILTYIASNPGSSPESIQPNLVFSDERLLRTLVLNLRRRRILRGETEKKQIRTEGFAAQPLDRISDLEDRFYLTDTGREFLRDESGFSSIPYSPNPLPPH